MSKIGRCRNFPSCIICSASRIVVSTVAHFGFGVITLKKEHIFYKNTKFSHVLKKKKKKYSERNPRSLDVHFRSDYLIRATYKKHQCTFVYLCIIAPYFHFFLFQHSNFTLFPYKELAFSYTIEVLKKRENNTNALRTF